MATAALNGTHLRRVNNQLHLGRRWLACGWRLLRRNPWLLGGMGFCASSAITVLGLIPFLGPLLIALAAPVMLTGALIAVDGVTRQRMPLPSRLRLEALRRSPTELVRPLRDGSGLTPAVAAGVYALVAALVINSAVRILVGGAWMGEWAALDLAPLLAVLGTAALATALYLALAVSLVFSLPLVLLQDEPVVPALQKSLRAGARHLFAVLTVIGVALAPFLAGILAGYGPAGAAPLATIAVGTLALPLAVSSAYCSYRTLFPVKDAPDAHSNDA